MTTEFRAVFPKRLVSIQALRGVAALLVLFFHLAEFQREMAVGNLSDINLISGIWDRGWAGVDLFFIISGFIMVYVARDIGNTIRDMRRFILSRIIRIYPLWWVCSGIMAGYFWIVYGMPAAPDRVSDLGEALRYSAKSFLLMPQDVPPLLGLGWSLIHEMYFYIIFAGILILPRKYLPVALSSWGMVTIFLALFIPPASYGRSLLELAASPLTLEFIAGGLGAYCILKGWVFKPRIFLIAGVLLAFLGLVIFPYVTFNPYTAARVTVFLIPFLCLVYGWVGCEIKGELTPPQWLVSLGNWSYSLYLTHYIVLVALRRLYRILDPGALNVGASGVLDNIIFALLALSLSILTACVFYNLIERPSLRFMKNRMS